MANLITLLRTLLCFVVIGILATLHPMLSAQGQLHPFSEDAWLIVAFVLTAVVFWMDGLDGFLARRLGESCKLGAVVDILGDRVVEQVYWVTFLALGWIPLWIPLVVLVRGIVVDGLRAVALEQGYTAFGEQTMMQSPWGVALVSSRFSRWAYAVCKAVAFGFLILCHMPNISGILATSLSLVAYGSAYLAVVFCVLRGLPVLLESKRLFQSAP